jgi:ComF family protein
MIWKSLLALFLEDNCPLCQRNTGEVFCLDCQRQLNQCQFTDSTTFWQGDLPLLVWGTYEQALKRAIASLKYDHKQQIGPMMGSWLGKIWLEAKLNQKYPQLLVIPIPLHQEKFKERGFNQAELIAQGFCRLTGYSLNTQGLIRIKKTQALFNFNPQERQQELSQAFAITKQLSLKNKAIPILLIDDIYTTGTTAQEARKILVNQGFSVVGIAAIATTKSR